MSEDETKVMPKYKEKPDDEVEVEFERLRLMSETQLLRHIARLTVGLRKTNKKMPSAWRPPVFGR